MGNVSQPNEKALYIIGESPHGRGEQLCLHLTTGFREGYLCFHDTNRGHMIKGKILEVRENGFSFEDMHGNLWEFCEVTIQDFKRSIYRCVHGGEEVVKLCCTTEELWEYYREKFPI